MYTHVHVYMDAREDAEEGVGCGVSRPINVQCILYCLLLNLELVCLATNPSILSPTPTPSTKVTDTLTDTQTFMWDLEI